MFSKLQERAVCLSIVKSNMTPTTHLHLLLYLSEGEFHVLLTRTHAHINNTQCISPVARNEFNTHTHCSIDTSLEQAEETETRWITTIQFNTHMRTSMLALSVCLSLHGTHMRTWIWIEWKRVCPISIENKGRCSEMYGKRMNKNWKFMWTKQANTTGTNTSVTGTLQSTMYIYLYTVYLYSMVAFYTAFSVEWNALFIVCALFNATCVWASETHL